MKIEKDKSLKEMTTFKIGGNAQFFCIIEKEEDIVEAVKFAKENNLRFFVLGGGSNILVSDKGFGGLVMKMEMKGIDFNGGVVSVKAGEDWDNFVGETVSRDLYGLENLSLIPGTCGAAPVQNIGAYGSEVKDTIVSVRALDSKKMEFRDFSNPDCEFEYRNSLFKREAGRYVISSVIFNLKKNGEVNTDYKDIAEYFLLKGIMRPSLKDVREAVVHIRTNKLPDVKVLGTAGSFFKNPILAHGQANELKKRFPELPVYPFSDENVKVSLAWILDHVCGFKGATKGNVGTYKNQALVLVNNGGATANEIKSFAHELARAVQEKTGIEVEAEIQYVGE
ncbi:MAG: UDP-N-acetylmuramate dehydrogenase [bacterium]|nr:UDP-N-acetylmuramate dehydrogenase [bacterium]